MKIAVDCRSLRKRPAGVPNFLLSFLEALTRNKPEWQLFLLCNENLHPGVADKLVRSKNVVIIVTALPFLNSIATLWYLFKVPIAVRRLAPDIFYTPIPNLPLWLPRKVLTFITVHDMVFKRFPETMSRTNWWINFFLHDRSIRNADRLWAVSEYTQTEVQKWFPKRKCDPIVVGSSVNENMFRSSGAMDTGRAQMKVTYDLPEKFILFVGTLEPRKNLKFLLSLIPHLAPHGFSLLVAGAEGWGDQASATKQTEKIKFAGFIPDKDLAGLYQMADIYVSTSLNEGFGLPQLEAMRCGCPVVAAHNSAMIEIVSGAGETVEGWDRERWVETILRVSANRDYYIQRGFKRAESFHWDQVVSNVVKYLGDPH